MPPVFLIAAAVPVLALAAVWAVREPYRGPVAVFASTVPFASGIRVPVPLPSPFNTLSTLLGVIAAGALAGNLMFVRRERSPVGAFAPFFGLLFAVIGCTWFWSIDPGQTAQSLLVLAPLAVMFFLFLAVTPTHRELVTVEVAVVLGGIGTAAYAIAMLHNGQLGATDAVARFGTAGGGGAAGDPNITAATLLLPLVLLLNWMISPRSWTVRVTASVGFLVVTFGLLLTGSRGGAIAAVVAALTLVCYRMSARGAVVSALMIAAVAAIAFMLLPSGLSQRFATSNSSGREQIWAVGVAVCERNCLVGTGYGTFATAYKGTLLTNPSLAGHGVRDLKAHNMWLALLVETGLAGVLVVLTALALLLRAVYRLGPAARAAPMAAVVGLVAANMFINNFAFKYFWLALGYATLVVAAERVSVSVPEIDVVRTPWPSLRPLPGLAGAR